MVKTCGKCKLSKSITEFLKRRQGEPGYRHWCKSCVNAGNKANYYKTKKQKHTKYVARTYNIDYDSLLALQGGACAICRTTNSGKRMFHIDHCHTTGKVRGLLCSNCNVGIGNLRDNIDILKSAVAYLERA